MRLTITENTHTLKKILAGLALSFVSCLPAQAQSADAAQNNAEKAKVQQQAQKYAICAALSDKPEKQKFSNQLITLLQQQNPNGDQSFSDQQINELSTKKITELEKNFQEYSSASRQKLHDKLCQENLKMDENFVGLGFQELPPSLQQKMRSIATCALLSNSFQLKQQAKQLTAANTLIMVAAGLNGREHAMKQLTELHTKIIEELKQLPEEQVKAEFQTSCEAVQQIQQQRKQLQQSQTQ
ncbi:conserved exported hypothetical protein [uncultured Thiomicrorhabdus sp.]